MTKMDDRSPLIWISCLDQPRTIKEIQDAWKITPDNYLYRGNVASKLIEKNLIKITKVESKNIYYKAIPDGLLDLFKERYPVEYPSMLKEWPLYSKFLFSEEVAKKFFSLDKIMILCRNDTRIGKELGYKIPLHVLGIINSFYRNPGKEASDDDLDIELHDTVNMIRNFNSTFNLSYGFDSAKYLEKIRVTADDLKRMHKEIEKTDN